MLLEPNEKLGATEELVVLVAAAAPPKENSPVAAGAAAVELDVVLAATPNEKL